jgi:hypothetical protein
MEDFALWRCHAGYRYPIAQQEMRNLTADVYNHQLIISGGGELTLTKRAFRPDLEEKNTGGDSKQLRSSTAAGGEGGGALLRTPLLHF